MVGTILNAAAILIGGIIGLWVKTDISSARQHLLKKLLGVMTVYVGLSMVWAGLNGSLRQIIRQLIVVIVALMLGKLTGHWLRLQRTMNRWGQYARRLFDQAKSERKPNASDGFITCSLLFCLGPLAILGSLQDGLLGSPRTLVIKSVMDGLAAMAFARNFGWGVLLSAIPVFTYQGTLTLIARLLEPYLEGKSLVDPIEATVGLLVFSVALVILGLKRVELADYLPSLVYAPLLALAWH